MAKARAKAAENEFSPATVSEADGVRYLHLGTPWVQGAMRIRASLTLELEYIRRMMVWLLLLPPDELAQGHAVQFGLGVGAITRFCYRRLHMRCTAVELNPKVVDACRQFFHLPAEAPDFRLVNADAGGFAADPAHAGIAQALCVDLYNDQAAGPVLDSAEFYADCFGLLAHGGAMTVNVFGRDASFGKSAAHIVAAFGATQVFSMRPTREGNTVIVALKSTPLPDAATFVARAQHIESRYKLAATKWFPLIRPLAVPAEAVEP